MQKVYVETTIKIDKNGKIRPLSIKWEDGHIFKIDKIIDTRNAASTKVGGCGIRYTIRIKGNETYLFSEDNKWFVEAK